MVERWKAQGMPLAKALSRFNKRGWGNIVGGILQACGEPDFLSNADEAAASLDETRREFTELVAAMAEHPQGIWMSGELVELCDREGLLAEDLGEGSARSRSTKMGAITGRFQNERFPLPDGGQAVFKRTDTRRGHRYQVFVKDEVPYLEPAATPASDLGNTPGTAP